MRIGSLFAGYGGLEMGVQGVWPDADLAWYSEIDKGALKVLEHHHPDVPNIGDVTTVDWSQVAQSRREAAGHDRRHAIQPVGRDA